MYVLNLRALIADFKKNKLGASAQRKYFWSLFFSYSLFLLLPAIYLLCVKQEFLALSLVGAQLVILLFVLGLYYRTPKNQSTVSFCTQFSAVAFVQFMRFLFLMILEITMLTIAALIIGLIVFLVYKLGALPSLTGYNLRDHRLLAGLLLTLIMFGCFLVFKLVFTGLLNSKIAKVLDQKIKLFFNEQEFYTLSPIILSQYLTKLGYCDYCGNLKCSVWHRCQYGQRFNTRYVIGLLVLGLIFFTLSSYYPLYNNSYASITLCITLVLFQLFWLRQVNLVLNKI